MPEGDLSAKRQEGQAEGNRGHQGLGDKHDPAAVGPIGNGSSQQGKNDHRQDAGQANPTQGDRLVGEGADVPVKGPDLHLGAGNRDCQAGPKQPELAMMKRWGNAEVQAQVPQSRR
jgi:hypothetical protein